MISLLLQINVPVQIAQKAVAPEMSLLELLVKGGWVLVPIILISILSIYIIVLKYCEIKKLTRLRIKFISGYKKTP